MIKEYWQENKFELITTFFIFTNLFPQWFPAWMYYLSFVMVIYKSSVFLAFKLRGSRLFIWFIAALWVASILGAGISDRLIVFSMVIFVCRPVESEEWHLYKLKLLKNIFGGFAIATIANFYAKLIGINMIGTAEAIAYHAKYGRETEFSGFSAYAMWTSCAAALSTLFFVNYVFSNRANLGRMKYVCFVMILISLYITMISASRSAFFLSLACSALIMYLYSEGRAGKIAKYIVITGVLATFIGPFLMDNASAMLAKKNGLEITTKNTSRDVLWSERVAEFESSPITGIGFAAHGVGQNCKIERFESGGSYISILAQTGILGVTFFVLIWLSSIVFPKHVPRHPTIVLLYAFFAYFTVHCILEGYMIQPGWYLCLIVWLVLGVIVEMKWFGWTSDQYAELLDQNADEEYDE